MSERSSNVPGVGSFNSENLAKVITDTWPTSTCVNFDGLAGPRVYALLTLCPLYGPSSLDGGVLLEPPNCSIAESRVASKLSAATKVAKAMHEHLVKVGGHLHINTVFANKGVLVKPEQYGMPSQKLQAVGEELLDCHSYLYKAELDKFCNQAGINYSYTTFKQAGVPFPTFVTANGIPGQVLWHEDTGRHSYPEEIVKKMAMVDPTLSEEIRMITVLNNFLKTLKLDHEITANKANRRLMKKLTWGLGTQQNTVLWLIAGYLAFDHMIPKMVGRDGVYLATERFEPLFGISNFTPGLKEMPRVHIKT